MILVVYDMGKDKTCDISLYPYRGYIIIIDIHGRKYKVF
jgi:hypothetical protein